MHLNTCPPETSKLSKHTSDTIIGREAIRGRGGGGSSELSTFIPFLTYRCVLVWGLQIGDEYSSSGCTRVLYTTSDAKFFGADVPFNETKGPVSRCYSVLNMVIPD